VTDRAVTALIFAKTDLGKTRDHNEDSFLVADLSAGRSSLHSEVARYTIGNRGLLVLVADGMGGAAAGELASAMAADLIFGHLVGTWAKEDETTPDRFTLRLREAVELANLQIHTYAREHPEVRGMGTTATVAGILGDHLYLAQVGDSRAYLVRHGKAVQITKDQSLTQRLVDAGEITEEEAEASSRRNIILQALGPDARIRVELTHEQISRGDTLVLCSDGLSGQVKREEIAEYVSRQTDLEKLGAELIGLANTRGGPDNITVVVAKFDGPGLPEAEVDPSYVVLDTESDDGAAPATTTESPVPAPAPVAVERTGSPAGMALLVIGVLIVLLAVFLAVI
jgi:protein phosphatase